MPPLSWLNSGALLVSCIASAALVFTALGAGPRRPVNVLFGLFAGAEAGWAAFALLTDVSLWVGRGDPRVPAELAMLFLTVMAPLLLAFTVRYLDGARAAADVAVLLGLALIAAGCVPLFRHAVVGAPRLSSDGISLVPPLPFGIVAAGLAAVFLGWSLVLFLRRGRIRRDPFVALGVLVLCLGLVDGVASPPFPLMTLSNAAGVLLLGYGVVRRGVLNPLRERARRLELIARVGSETTAILDLDELLHRSVGLIRDEFGYYNVSILLVDSDVLLLRAAAREEMRRHERSLRIRIGAEGITGHVAGTGEPLVVPDVDKDGRYLKGDGDVRSRSEAAVPIRLKGAVIGVLDVQSDDVNAFSAVDVFTMETIADQLAVAIDNARLYDAVRVELRERTDAEEKFRTLAEQSPNMIFMNLGGRVVYANQRCTEVVGYSREEMLAPPFDFRCLIASESAGSIDASFARHSEGLDVPPYEHTLVARDGHRVDVIITTRLVTYGGERAILGIVTDITLRKRTERLLQELNAAALRMEHVMTPDGIFPALGEGLAALGISSTVLEGEIGQRSFRVIFSSRGAVESGTAVPIVPSGLLDRVLQRRETTFLPPAGGAALPSPLPPGPAIVAPLIADEAVAGLLVVQAEDLVAADVSTVTALANQAAAAWRKTRLMEELERSLRELEQAQEQLVQSGKMEAVGRLAGGVAHDFNNLLTAIGGYAELLQDAAAEDAPERGYADQIVSAAAKAGALTRQLLAFSRKQVVEPRAVDLNAVVRGLAEILKRLMGEHIELVTRLDPDVDTVQADPTQIEQAVMNLAINAGDAMPRGGLLTIETCAAEVRTGYGEAPGGPPPGWYVRLAVSDTGVGMDRSVMDHLFEPFFTTKERGKGTGLGLATVYGVVKQWSGYVTVESEPGRGSTFRIFLPRLAAPVKVAERESAEADRVGGRETVLVVEDDPAVRELASGVLARCGYEVLQADRAVEALRVCEERGGSIHLVLTDIVMPGGLSGRELAAHLVTSRPELRVLLMSGYADFPAIGSEAAARDLPLLEKPFSPYALVRKVREVLDAPR